MRAPRSFRLDFLGRHTAMVALLGVLASCPPAATADSPAERFTAEVLREAVKRLGADQFADREEASRLLWQAGRRAIPFVERAAESSDPEVRDRARRLLQKFRYGIFPDTPPEVVQLIHKFRQGDDGEKRQAFGQLVEKAPPGTMLALIRLAEPGSLRDSMQQHLIRVADRAVPELLSGGDFEQAESLLEMSAVASRGARNYAVYLHLQGGMQRKRAELQTRSDLSPDDYTLLAWMHRVAGNLPAAREAAEKSNGEAPWEEILYDLRAFDELARRYEAWLSEDAHDIELLGQAAAWHRLAGNQNRFDELVALLKDHAQVEGKENQSWYAAEALLINNRPQAAIEMLEQSSSPVAFKLFVVQKQYRRALMMLGIEPTEKGVSRWIASLAPGGENATLADDQEASPRLATYRAVVELLEEVGYRDAAAQLADHLVPLHRAAQARAGIAPMVRLYQKIGLVEKADRLAVADESLQAPSRLVRVVFPQQWQEALSWWNYFRSAGAPPEAETLAAVRSLLQVNESTENQPVNLSSHIEGLASQATGSAAPEAERRQILETAAAACRRLRWRDQQQKYLEQLNALDASQPAALQLGDMAAEQGDWQSASQWYGKSYQADPTRVIAVYLQGVALEKLLQPDKATKLKQLAGLLPLGDTRARGTLADQLEERGFDAAARTQLELLLRMGDMHDWTTNNAAMKLGNALSGKEHRRVAHLWQRLLLSAIRRSTAFLEQGAYLRLPHLIHKARVKAALEEQDLEMAVQQIELSLAALPGETQLATSFVPALDEAGKTAQADQLFQAVLARYQEGCEIFPQSGTLHNNLAWLAARCQRKLELALVHAQRAAELQPDRAAYIDTLAEVHFRLGNASRAIELAEQCLAMEPKNKFFAEQLERFRAAARAADKPVAADKP